MVTSPLLIEKRNVFGSKNGLSVSDSDTTINVGASVKFMSNFLTWTFMPFLVQSLFSQDWGVSEKRGEL